MATNTNTIQPTVPNAPQGDVAFRFMDGGGYTTSGQSFTAPVKANVGPTVTTQNLGTTPKTSLDINALISENQKNYQTYLSDQKALQSQYTNALKPDDNITSLTKQLNELRTSELNTKLGSAAGIQKAGQKVIPMEFIVGQQENIAQQANLQLQTLASQQAPLIDQLSLAQDARSQLLKGLEVLMQFGKENYSTAQDNMNFTLGLQKYQKELDNLAKQEQQAAKEFALQYGVNKDYYNIGGTVYRTSDGKAYSTPEEFLGDGGQWGKIQEVDPIALQERELVRDLITSYPDAGISLDDNLASAQSKLSKSRIYGEKVRPPSSGQGGDGTPRSTTDASVRKFIEDNKKANPDMAWYDLWGELSDDIRNNLKVDPSNYDSLFWELLHPEGSTGYNDPKNKNTNTANKRSV